jgi:hypothetical protein
VQESSGCQDCEHADRCPLASVAALTVAPSDSVQQSSPLENVAASDVQSNETFKLALGTTLVVLILAILLLAVLLGLCCKANFKRFDVLRSVRALAPVCDR